MPAKDFLKNQVKNVVADNNIGRASGPIGTIGTIFNSNLVDPINLFKKNKDVVHVKEDENELFKNSKQILGLVGSFLGGSPEPEKVVPTTSDSITGRDNRSGLDKLVNRVTSLSLSDAIGVASGKTTDAVVGGIAKDTLSGLFAKKQNIGIFSPKVPDNEKIRVELDKEGSAFRNLQSVTSNSIPLKYSDFFTLNQVFELGNNSLFAVTIEPLYKDENKNSTYVPYPPFHNKDANEAKSSVSDSKKKDGFFDKAVNSITDKVTSLADSVSNAASSFVNKRDNGEFSTFKITEKDLFDKWLPVTEFSFSRTELRTSNLKVNAGLNLSIPFGLDYSLDLSTTIVDSNDKKVLNYLQNYLFSISPDSMHALPYNAACSLMNIYILNRLKEVVYVLPLYVYPIVKEDFEGNSSSQVPYYIVQWNVLGENYLSDTPSINEVRSMYDGYLVNSPIFNEKINSDPYAT